MLAELHVENFGLMERVNLRFDSGFLVFTGETGAGKSMLVDALGVLLGGRASSEFIRHGKEKTSVEGIFSNLPIQIMEILKDEGYQTEDGLLFLYREINVSGRNVCRVQGKTVPLSLYRSFCEGLIDIHGQMEHQSLLRTETHRDLLDRFGGELHLELLRKVKEAAVKYRDVSNKERELLRTERDREKREEYLRYQIDEIEKIDPVPGEEKELEQEKKFMQNSEKILKLVSEAYEELYEGEDGTMAAFDLTGAASRNIEELCELDPVCKKMKEQIESIYYSLEDFVEQLRNYKETLEFEPDRLDQIESRLIELHKLRKYAYDIEAVLKKKEDMEKELDEINHLMEEKEKIKTEKREALISYNDLAEELSIKRGMQAGKIEKGLRDELQDIGLSDSRVEIIFTPITEPSQEGAEQIEFYFTANVGEPAKPLVKVVSGGEMSRIMLAFKSLLARVETVDTFVFDEVDSGVGGRTIKQVAQKLVGIAKIKQVFCITHSPAVAAMADQHYGINKSVFGERTMTEVMLLDEEKRIEELTRMLGGEEIAEGLAKEMWKKAKLN
ncbi:MAG: DNA repair protein RecN [Eubacteriales bacterium]